MSKDKLKVVRTQEVPVSPQHCLWFAWAPDEAEGPYGESMGECRPQGRAINPNLSNISIEVVSSATLWRHGGGDEEVTSAAGRTDCVRGTKRPYRNGEYNSEFIYAMPMPLNLLVAMFGTSSAPTYENPVEQKAIGLGSDEPFPIPEFPTEDRFLFLGMHDGYQWNNNSAVSEGMMVRLTWYSRI